MANATLNPIYERLNNAPAFHPLTAETFADWSMEAGDIVTISRDGNTYTSPVGTSRMVWRGSQQISIDSTGTREREPISKVSRRKFSRGGGTANNNAFFYNEIFSDDGEVHSIVQQTASTFSVEVSKRARVFESYEDPVSHGETVSPGDFWIKTNNVETWDEFMRVSWVYGSDFDWNDYKGAIVYVRTEYNTWRMVSNQQILLDHSTKIEQDENHISLIAQDVQRIDGNVEKNYAELKVESDRISSEVISTRENLASSIEQTASSIRSEVSTLDGQLSSSITQTASSIRSEVSDSYSGLSTTITQTSSTFNVEVGKRARVFISYEDPVRMGETVSKNDFWVKTNDIETWDEFHGVDWSYSSTFNWNDYKGCITYIRTEQGTWRLLANQQEILDHSTRIDQDEDHISLIAQDVQRVDGNVQKNYAEFRVTSQAISAEVVDTRNNLSSNITQTASSIRSEVSNSYEGLSSSITQTASSIRSEVSDSYSGLSTTITQTSSTFNVEVGKRARVFINYEDPVRMGETVSKNDFWVKTNDVETWDEFHGVDWSYSSTFNWNDYKGCITYIRTEQGTWRLLANQQEILDHSTRIDQDEDHISLIAQDVQRIDGNVQKNYAEFRVTSQAISAEVVDTRNNLSSNIRQTASSIRAEVSTLDGQLSSSITQTASSIRSEVSNNYEGLSSSITQTASSIRSEVSNNYEGLSSSITQTASSIRSEVSNSYEGLSSNITQTASNIRSEVSSSYEGLSSNITQTASNIRSEVSSNYEGLSSNITQTASNIRSEVSSSYEGLSSNITQTASNIRSEVSSNYEGLSSNITQTASNIRSEVSSNYEGLSSNITQTASNIRSEVSSNYTGLSSRITQESYRISLVVEGSGTGAKIKPASIVAAINNGESSIVISASHIDLNGYVKASDLTAEYFKSKIAAITALEVHSLHSDSNIGAEGNITASDFYIGTPGESGNDKLSDAIKSLQITQSGNTYKLQKKSYFDSDWVDIGSFSRAVTRWSIGGGNGNVNVTAVPQQQTAIVPVRISGSINITTNNTYTFRVYSETQEGEEFDTGASLNVTVAVPGETHTNSMNITRVIARIDAEGDGYYYGRLYRYNAESGQYEAVTSSDRYWYYSTSNKSGTTTVWY